MRTRAAAPGRAAEPGGHAAPRAQLGPPSHPGLPSLLPPGAGPRTRSPNPPQAERRSPGQAPRRSRSPEKKGGASSMTSLPLPARSYRPRWISSGQREKSLFVLASGQSHLSSGGLVRGVATEKEPKSSRVKRGLEGRGEGRAQAGCAAVDGGPVGRGWGWGRPMEMLLTKAFLSGLSLTLAVPLASCIICQPRKNDPSGPFSHCCSQTPFGLSLCAWTPCLHPGVVSVEFSG